LSRCGRIAPIVSHAYLPRSLFPRSRTRQGAIFHEDELRRQVAGSLAGTVFSSAAVIPVVVKALDDDSKQVIRQ
jgi:hypothetical protein